MPPRPPTRAQRNAQGPSPFAEAFSRRPLEFQNAAINNAQPQTRASRNANPRTAGNGDVPGPTVSNEPVNPASSTVAPPMILPSSQALVIEEEKLNQRLRSLSGQSAQGLLSADQFKSAVRRQRNDFAKFKLGNPAS